MGLEKKLVGKSWFLGIELRFCYSLQGVNGNHSLFYHCEQE
jgi:hypothetical protein